MRPKNRALYFFKSCPEADIRLLCFPYAGGDGPTIFRRWPQLIPASIEVCAVQVPGRGIRVAEPPATDLQANACNLVPALLPFLDKPFSFFGHSMGALLSFEISRLLSQQYGLEPVHLFVSGRGAPHVPDRDPPTYNLPEAEFLEELKRLNGTPPDVLKHDELMKLMMPLLRADFQACQTYAFMPGPKLRCPLTVFGGLEDEATPEDLDAWGQHTNGTFCRRMLPGDHFFVNTQPRMLLQLLLTQLLPHVPTRRSYSLNPVIREPPRL